MSTSPDMLKRFADEVNLHELHLEEAPRWLAIGGGGLLALYGLSRGSVPGLLLSLAGGALAYAGWRSGALEAPPAYAAGAAPTVTHQATLAAPPDAVYAYLRDFGNWPAWASHVASADALDARHTTWRSPEVFALEWTTETTDETPGRRFAWRSLPGADVEAEGEVQLTPHASGGAEVRLRLAYAAPALLARRRPLDSRFYERVSRDMEQLQPHLDAHFAERASAPGAAGAPPASQD